MEAAAAAEAVTAATAATAAQMAPSSDGDGGCQRETAESGRWTAAMLATMQAPTVVEVQWRALAVAVAQVGPQIKNPRTETLNQKLLILQRQTLNRESLTLNPEP